MSYRIIVTKTESDPQFMEKMAEFETKHGRRDMGYNNDYERRGIQVPQEEIVKNVLLVELTDDEYKSLKKEIIKTFE